MVDFDGIRTLLELIEKAHYTALHAIPEHREKGLHVLQTSVDYVRTRDRVKMYMLLEIQILLGQISRACEHRDYVSLNKQYDKLIEHLDSNNIIHFN